MSSRLSITCPLLVLLLSLSTSGRAADTSVVTLSYRVRPDLSACEVGALTETTRQQMLVLLNRLRGLHGLMPLAYAPTLQSQADAAALVMAANGAVSHVPATDWRCLSPLARQGARASLLYGGAHSARPIEQSGEDIVASWLLDTDNVEADSLGHRRWLLDPFLREVAFAWVSGPLADGEYGGAAVLRLGRGRSAGRAAAQSDFVAYPVGDYPARYADLTGWLSFSVLVDPARPGASRNVDYRRARVQVHDPDGNMLALRELRYDNDDFGLPNNLQFRVAGLRAGVRYQVAVDGVVVAGAPREFRYWFRVAR